MTIMSPIQAILSINKENLKIKLKRHLDRGEFYGTNFSVSFTKHESKKAPIYFKKLGAYQPITIDGLFES